ncbi:hypothetical protein [Phenylobacterium aquaticum]|uniref:hypothetical protein n=1 Tax=Phenylobacterium aquaticum TaxID=1763816 RepID=UPI0026F0ED72|nr:hypothetical protein [Phenylobacterium aquaticum]
MGKKKTKTSSQETSHSVTTPNNPSWVDDAAGSLNSSIQKYGQTDPYSRVAPLSDLERQAASGASQLGGGGDPDAVGGTNWFSNLMQAPAPSVSSASLLDNLGAYMNPYRDQVTNAAMADFDADAGRTRATQDLALAGQGAFGGSGAALTRSLTESELARARNSQLSKLNSDMFNAGATLSGQDADRRQQASAANAQLAQQNAQWRGQLALDRQAGDRANVATQAALGQQLRGADQVYRDAPTTALSKQIEMFSGLPLQLFHGQTSDSNGTSNSTQTTSGTTLGDIAGLLSGAGSLMSGAGAIGVHVK